MEHSETQNRKPDAPEEIAASTEGEIPTEERRRIEEFLRTLEHNDEGTEANTSLRRLLYNEGANTARIIIEKIHTHLSDTDISDIYANNFKIYRYVDWLSYAATTDQSGEITKLLAQEKIILDPDRSTKIKLLNTLGRVGKKDNVEAILEFLEKTFLHHEEIYGHDPYTVRFKAHDALNALQTIVRIASRGNSFRDVREDVADAFSRINILLREAGLEPFQEEELSRHYDAAILANHDFYESLNPREMIPEQHTNDYDDGWGRVTASNEWNREAASFDEELEDQQLLLEFTRNEFSVINDRLETIRNLRKNKKIENGLSLEESEHDKALMSRHFLELRETHPSRYTPSLGIEIEIREEAVIPPEERFHYKNHSELEALSDAEQESYYLKIRNHDYLVKELRNPYYKTKEAGIPSGFDKFWEFAHRPVKYYATLSREVQALMELGLLNQTYQKYPLHLTVGGIAARGKDRGETFLLARVLEGTGWSTRERRLLRTYYAKKETWTCKGIGGVKDRHEFDQRKLELGTKEAAEIRTFQLQTLSGLERLLKSAYFLGAALRAFQKEAVLERLGSEKNNDVALDETEKRLADIWRTFSESTKKLFEASNLKNPSEVWEPPEPYDEDRRSDFVPFAKLLGEAESDPKSYGAEFVGAMRKLVIAARKEAKNAIYT